MKKQLNFRIEEDLLDMFDAKCGSQDRTSVIVQLIRDFVGGAAPARELDAKDKAAIFSGEVKMSKLVQDLALKALQSRGDDVFENLSDNELAKLVISQLPKPKDVDGDLQADMLSLKQSLEKLPSVEDISGELNRTKFALNRLLHERDIQQAVVAGLRKRLNKDMPGAWDEFKRGIELAMEKARERALEADARGFDLDLFKPLVAPE